MDMNWAETNNKMRELYSLENDLKKAQKAVNGLLNPKEEETIGQQEPPKEEIKQSRRA